MSESPRHDFDRAIDRVAAQLVAVREDSDLLPHVMARLPERAPSTWFLAMPVQLAAGAALVLLAFLYGRPSREVTRRESLAVTAGASAIEARPLEAPRRPVAAPIPDPRSLIRDPRSPIPALALARPDYDRSLAPVEALEGLELRAIAAPFLEIDAAAVIAPLVLSELPLASDTSQW